MSPTQFLLPYFCYEHSGNGCQQNSCMLPGRPITLRMLNRRIWPLMLTSAPSELVGYIDLPCCSAFLPSLRNFRPAQLANQLDDSDCQTPPQD